MISFNFKNAYSYGSIAAFDFPAAAAGQGVRLVLPGILRHSPSGRQVVGSELDVPLFFFLLLEGEWERSLL